MEPGLSGYPGSVVAISRYEVRVSFNGIAKRVLRRLRVQVCVVCVCGCICGEYTDVCIYVCMWPYLLAMRLESASMG